MSDTLGFIGLGQMGVSMAANLLKAGYGLRVHNRTAAKARPLVEQGAWLVNTPGEVVEPGGIVVTMLADDRALEEVVLGKGGILECLGTGGLHLSASTISPDTSRRLAALHEQQGSHYLAMPVFGRPEAAAAGKLWICLSGNPTAKERGRPVCDALGQGVFDFGEEVGAANVVKLTGNFLITAAIEAMAEAFTLAEKNGIERGQVAALIGQTLFACPLYQNYGRMIAQEKYQPAGFRLELGRKDIDLVLQTARSSLTPMPLAHLVYDRLTAAVARGRGDLDWSGMALEVSEAAGLRS